MQALAKRRSHNILEREATSGTETEACKEVHGSIGLLRQRETFTDRTQTSTPEEAMTPEITLLTRDRSLPTD